MSETPDGQTLEGVRYALALMRGRLETAAPAHVPIIRSHIREVEALHSRAEDADTLRTSSDARALIQRWIAEDSQLPPEERVTAVETTDRLDADTLRSQIEAQAQQIQTLTRERDEARNDASTLARQLHELSEVEAGLEAERDTLRQRVTDHLHGRAGSDDSPD